MYVCMYVYFCTYACDNRMYVCIWVNACIYACFTACMGECMKVIC